MSPLETQGKSGTSRHGRLEPCRVGSIHLRFGLRYHLAQSTPLVFSIGQTAALLAAPFRNASRSALIVSASVVGMPCGKPL